MLEESADSEFGIVEEILLLLAWEEENVSGVEVSENDSLEDISDMACVQPVNRVPIRKALRTLYGLFIRDHLRVNIFPLCKTDKNQMDIGGRKWHPISVPVALPASFYIA